MRRAPGCCSAGGRAASDEAPALGASTSSASSAASAAPSSGRPTARASSAAAARFGDPLALDGRALSGTTGAVLDPDRGAARSRAPARPARSSASRSPPASQHDRDAALGAGAQVSRRQRRGARAVDGVHARAHHAAAPRPHRRSRDPLRSPRVARVRRRRVVHQPDRSGAEHARAVEPLGLRHLGRSADRARARHRNRRPVRSCVSCFSRRNTGASRACGPTS